MQKCLAVAAIGGAQQGKKSFVLVDGHQRSIPCMPIRCRYKTECKKLNLANVRIHEVSEFLLRREMPADTAYPGAARIWRAWVTQDINKPTLTTFARS